MENELSRIVDAIPGLVCTATPDGRVDSLNQLWCEYTVITMENIEQPRSRTDPVNGIQQCGFGSRVLTCHRQTFCTTHEKVQSSCR
jgi:hypothetical protein